MFESYNLRMIGTLRKNKRQVPESFKRTASAGTIRVGYDGNLTLTSYCPKKKQSRACIVGAQICKDGQGQVETRNSSLLQQE